MVAQREGWRPRRSYARIATVIDLPNMIETQQKSYEEFLQAHLRPEKRDRVGLQDAFMSVFPIKGRDNTELAFVGYSLGRPKYNIMECVDRGMTYAAALRIKVRLVIKESAKDRPADTLEVREEDIYLGDIPLMTEKGTFIVNGAERVVVSQLHRSPGPSFGTTTHPSGKRLVTASIIPNRGAWLEFESDPQEVVSVVIDRKRKMPVTVLLRAFGYETDEEIMNLFCKFDTIHVTSKTAQRDLVGQVLAEDAVDPDTGVVVAQAATYVDRESFARIREIVGGVDVKIVTANADDFRFLHATLAKDSCGHGEDELSPRERALLEIYHMMRPGEPPAIKNASALFENLFTKSRRYDLSKVGRYRMNKKLHLALPMDCVTLTPDDLTAMVRYIFKLQRGEGLTDDIDHLGNRRVRTIGELLENQFRAGLARMEKSIREKMGILDLESVMPRNLINAKAITSAVNEFFGRSQLSQFLDQINPLAELTHKRRLSALGPGGLNRDRAGFEVRDVHHTHYGRICPIETPEGPNIGLISSLATYAKINEFGFIETPYRKAEDGKVSNEIVFLSADDEESESGDKGRRKPGGSGIFIAQANALLDEKGKFVEEAVLSRNRDEYPLMNPKEINYMDVSPMQLVSVSAALIPFLEHDDANRALMGSNMQRQAVPLLRTEAPLVGTGIEHRVAKDSRVVIAARRGGTVSRATAEEIVIDCGTHRDGTSDQDRYPLLKFLRSNQDTCINQRPIVRKGQTVKEGDVIADGPATDQGELALGKNVLCAFMSWEGFNFEDAILVSERLIRDESFTSIHIKEFKTEARDTKLGEEEITRDIPNVGEEALRNLDENGIIRIGARVKPGDILVGKVSPKGKTQTTNVEKLLRAIFGKRAEDVRDISLKAPPGTEGIVVDVKEFSRKIKGTRSKAEEDRMVKKLQQERDAGYEELAREIQRRLGEALQGKTLAADVIDPGTGEVLIPEGTKLTRQLMASLEGLDLKTVQVKQAQETDQILIEYEQRREDILQEFDKQVDYIKSGDNLPPGVIKLVKVYVATKRKLAVGDKVAGRHGNKGVVSRILPMEDMPFLEDGTPVDIVLNPLGVPSRMNVGQVLETHLGWAAKARGEYVSTPVFDGAQYHDIAIGLRQASFLTGTRGETDPLARDRAALLEGYSSFVEAAIALKRADMAESATTKKELHDVAQKQLRMSEDEAMAFIDEVIERYSKTVLYDGKTGEPFKERVMVGFIYMMKLNHLVDDKIHARSIGPYSLVTQQPLGGKAQFGGQRLGEMEVWALEAYGAAYTLQELLTVKSDDVVGRNKVYEAIVKGENTKPPGLPESFYVLVKELQSLGLAIDLVETEEGETFLDKSRPSALQRRLAGEVV